MIEQYDDAVKKFSRVSGNHSGQVVICDREDHKAGAKISIQAWSKNGLEQ